MIRLRISLPTPNIVQGNWGGYRLVRSLLHTTVSGIYLVIQLLKMIQQGRTVSHFGLGTTTKSLLQKRGLATGKQNNWASSRVHCLLGSLCTATTLNTVLWCPFTMRRCERVCCGRVWWRRRGGRGARGPWPGYCSRSPCVLSDTWAPSPPG